MRAAGHYTPAMNEFSRLAGAYAAARPTYPPELFAYLAALTGNHELAWDCATGNGQAAIALAAHYRRVAATDLSREQVARGRPHPQVSYWVASAEGSGLRDGCVDLVTVATGAHYLDHARFYAESRRVLKPGGVLAVWGYHLCRLDHREIDAALESFYALVEPWFPPGLHYLTARYRTMPFPEGEVEAPAFTMRADWDLGSLLRFIATWSGARRYADAHGDPLPALAERIAAHWGDAGARRPVFWDLALRVARF